jgi:hypothetical protein
MVCSVSIRSWESRSALLEHLKASKARTLMVGLNAEAPRAYYSFSLTSSQGPAEVGIISSGLGINPAAILLDKGGRVLVGHDTWVTWIDVGTLAVTSSRRLGGVFFEFLSVERDDEMVVLHELGALRVDASGSAKWSVDTDVVEDSITDEKGNLFLTVMDGPKVVVSLASGAVLKPVSLVGFRES